MPPRRSARVADAVERATPALAPLQLPLPLALVHRIFLAVPADSRGRAACVARGWRDALADPALWTRLDLSGNSGISFHMLTSKGDALLRGAAARARGELRELEITLRSHVFQLHALFWVLAANAGSLRVLRVDEAYFGAYGQTNNKPTTVEAFLAAAPLLEVLETDVTCSLEDAARLMIAQGPLRVRALTLVFKYDIEGVNHMDIGCNLARISPFAAALADVALQPVLSAVHICRADFTLEALNAFVDALVTRRLSELGLHHRRVSWLRAAAPLARLLAGGSLKMLIITSLAEEEDDDILMFAADGAALVANALRANTTLTTLFFQNAGLLSDIRAATAVLGALVGHPSVRKLVLKDERSANLDAAVGAALAAIVAADSPALQELSIDNNDLSDDALGPLVDALRGNRHLRRLDMTQNDLSEAFTRERLLPAVQANTGLRYLVCYDDSADDGSAAQEVEDLVNRRGQVA
jgi:hypothetical protein